MKRALSILFTVCYFLNSCSTYPKLNGVYASSLKDTIIIAETGTLINSKGHQDNRMIVKQRKDVLKFKTTWYQNRLFNPPHKLYFKIRSVTDQQIVLAPITKWAKIMFENRDSLILDKLQ